MSDLIPAIGFEQNENIILLFNISAGDLKEISYFNARDIDRENGLQRKFDSNRSNAIAEFIDGENSLLANNIIINLELDKHGLSLSSVFDGENLNIGKLKDVVRKTKQDSKYNKIAFVVDGQHRLRAFEKINKDSFQLPVSALINLSLAESAELFVQINYNQKPVNKSHVFDLLGISENIFPKYFILHRAATLLQEDPGSPFYNQIKMLGVGKGYISQSSLITALEKYKLQKIVEDGTGTCNEEDIYDVVWHFFVAVKESFPRFWGEKKLLSKTVGIRALIKLMSDMLKLSFENSEEYSSDYICKKFSLINEDFFNDEKFDNLIGEKGVLFLHYNLKKELGI